MYSKGVQKWFNYIYIFLSIIMMQLINIEYLFNY